MKKERFLSDLGGVAIIAAGLAAGLAPAAQAASHPQARWIADPRTGCKVWDPAPQAGESIRWSGPCKDGLATGKGTVVWFEHGQAGDRYTGAYRHGKRNGYGVVTYANGETVKGDWSDGELIQLPANEIDYRTRR